jgi:hypothetical protein
MHPAFSGPGGILVTGFHLLTGKVCPWMRTVEAKTLKDILDELSRTSEMGLILHVTIFVGFVLEGL